MLTHYNTKAARDLVLSSGLTWRDSWTNACLHLRIKRCEVVREGRWKCGAKPGRAFPGNNTSFLSLSSSVSVAPSKSDVWQPTYENGMCSE